MDLFKDGKAHGSVAQSLMEHGFDPGAMRPYIDIGEDGSGSGRSLITTNARRGAGNTALARNAATLRINEWKIIDQAVTRAAKERLQFIPLLRNKGLTYDIGNGLAHTVLQTQTMGDITTATVSMDPIRQSESDRPEFDSVNLPLPVIHKDFDFSLRQLSTSRNLGQGLDVTMAELAGRRVAEEAEKLALGLSSTFTYGGGSVYGATNFPSRMTKTMVYPEITTWTPSRTLADILAMRKQAADVFHWGPYILLTSPAWAPYLDQDFKTNGDITLRERILKITEITAIQQADYLTGYQMVLIQLTSDVIRLVNGMDITTVQWETEGGFKVNFKVIAMWVPQVRNDAAGNTGIVHGVAT